MGKQRRAKGQKQAGQTRSKTKKETAVFMVAGVRKAKTKIVGTNLKKVGNLFIYMYVNIIGVSYLMMSKLLLWGSQMVAMGASER